MMDKGDWYLVAYLAVTIPLLAWAMRRWLNRQIIDAIKELK